MRRGKVDGFGQRMAMIAFDFDTIIEPPDAGWRRWILIQLERFPKIHARLERFYIARWFKVTLAAEQSAYWLWEQQLDIGVVLRRKYTIGIQQAVEKVLSQFPNHEIKICEYADTHLQARDIENWCNRRLVHRFFTTDIELSKWMSGNLVCTAPPNQWKDENSLLF